MPSEHIEQIHNFCRNRDVRTIEAYPTSCAVGDDCQGPARGYVVFTTEGERHAATHCVAHGWNEDQHKGR